jgi:glycerophosphoryl diester phosphodiesterase
MNPSRTESRTRYRTLGASFLLLLSSGCVDLASPTGPATGATPPEDLNLSRAHARVAPLPSSVEDLLGLGFGPIAIAHRGMGANLGEDPTRPVENTMAAVRAGYAAGARVVELDLQITGDGEIVMWHDDFLPDFTCMNTLSRAELAERAPHIPSFQAVLQAAIRQNRSNPDRVTGLLTVDLKPPSPLCDPHDLNEASIVDAVVRIVRRMGATDLVYFNSMSPVMLGLARERAPEIRRQLTVLALQFLSAEQVEAALGLPVVEIPKDAYGLQWGEIGPIHRLPGYSTPAQALGAAMAVDASIVSWDLLFLGQLEQMGAGQGADLVQATKALGIHVFSGDVSAPEHWSLGASLGAQALYVDDVPLGVALESTARR